MADACLFTVLRQTYNVTVFENKMLDLFETRKYFPGCTNLIWVGQALSRLKVKLLNGKRYNLF